MGFAETFKALGDPVRREILLLLRRGRLSAGEIGSHFEMTGATISYHLGILKKADLVYETREKNYIYYELNTTVFQQMILWMQQLGGERDEKTSGCGNDTALSTDGGGHELPAGAGADAL